MLLNLGKENLEKNPSPKCNLSSRPSVIKSDALTTELPDRLYGEQGSIFWVSTEIASRSYTRFSSEFSLYMFSLQYLVLPCNTMLLLFHL